MTAGFFAAGFFAAGFFAAGFLVVFFMASSLLFAAGEMHGHVNLYRIITAFLGYTPKHESAQGC